MRAKKVAVTLALRRISSLRRKNSGWVASPACGSATPWTA
jgi:hypothetical protein